MSKITLGELWEKLDKNELGTEKARFKIIGDTLTLMGIYGGNRNLIVQDTDGGFMPLSPNEEVEWPIQEKKEKVLYPALVEFEEKGDIRTRVEFFKDEEMAIDLSLRCGFDILEWNPEGYPPITVKE